MNDLVFATDWHMSSQTPSSRIDDYPNALLLKFQFLLNEARASGNPLILGGDIFHTPGQPDYIKDRIITMIKAAGVDVYSVWGNHDLLYYNPDFAEKTSLGLLFNSGWIKELDVLELKNGWTVYGQKILQPLPEVKPGGRSIIISHCFYQNEHGDRLNVTYEEAMKSDATFLCMGHDHNQYPIKTLPNGLQIIRPGACSRGSSATENKVRTLAYARICMDTGTAKYVPIPVNKFEDVFREKFKDVPKVAVGFNDIRDFIDKLRESEMAVNPYDILIEMDLKDEVYVRCRDYLQDAGLTRTLEKV